MRFLPELFVNNRRWAAERLSSDPGFFERQMGSQEPPYLWIGCADSRVPANEIVGLEPGKLFVHRNVANVVADDDLNGQAVLQYAVDYLNVHHVIVCGHYGCGGVRAALGAALTPPLESWISHIRDVRQAHREEVESLPTEEEMWSRLCEMNVIAQAESVCRSKIVREAWRRGQALVVHGWIYDLGSGLLRDLEVTEDGSGALGIGTAGTRQKV